MAFFAALQHSYFFIISFFVHVTYGFDNTSWPVRGHGLLPQDTTHLLSRDIPSNYPFKIVCVGDSITYGLGDDHPDSTGNDFNMDGLHNGYRLDLYNLLVSDGYSPTFIGGQKSGTDNPQPNFEAWGGYWMTEIESLLESDDPWTDQPNLILVHAGTNDVIYGNYNETDPILYFEGMPTRLGNLLDYILCNAPDAVVIVAMLIQNTGGPAWTPCWTDWLNAQIPAIVGERYMKGYKIMATDMSMINTFQENGGLHPNPTGYQDMANLWHSAIQNVPTAWWDTSGSNGGGNSLGSIETCDRNSISFSLAIGGAQVNGGFHVSGDTPAPDASTEPGSTFSPGWGDSSNIALGCGHAGSGVLFADLTGNSLNDYLWANYTDPSTGAIDAWLNDGHDGWNPVNNGDPIAWGVQGTAYVEMADLDGDGKAEYILVNDGEFHIWHNEGPEGSVWNWVAMPNAANELNYLFPDVPYHYFADITGSGRADLIISNPNTVLDLYINDGSDGNGGFTWTQCKAIGEAIDIPMFADIDGDGKADYVAKDSEGGLRGWINNYAGGCNLTWLPINGATPKSLALGASVPPGQVYLADFTGDKKADYLVVDPANGAVTMWPNVGSTHPPDNPGLGGFGAAVRLSDLNGDGLDDYITVTDYSGLAAELNRGQGSGGSVDTWTWDYVENGNVIALGYSGATRDEVHMADMNADGRADYLIVDDTSGAIHCYLNLGQGSSNWDWDTSLGEIAIGVGGVGAGVRLADFDGDGKADYIYLNESGAAYVWINGGPASEQEHWVPVNGGAVAAIGINVNRDNIFFADIDGDAKADYCYIHPDTGALEVWYNTYTAGGPVGWAPGGQVISGQGFPGRNMRLARLGTSGRYDYVALDEDTGAISKAWINECSNVIGTARRPIAGQCGAAPLATQTTSQPVPVFTQRNFEPCTRGPIPPVSGYTAPTGSSSTSAMITAPPAQCTSTFGNGAVAVYATTDSSGKCSGASRVVFNGQQLSVKVESLRSAEVNHVTGTQLYTSISEALMTACPSPDPSSTVSACSAVTPVSGIEVDIDAHCFAQGKLNMFIPYVRYSDNNVRMAMINAIAAIAGSSSTAPDNQHSSGSSGGPSACLVDVSTIPSLMEVVYSNQGLSTNGNIVLSNLEVQFSMTQPQGGAYTCVGLTEGNDLASLAGMSDALSSLNLGDYTGVFGPAIGLSCLIIDAESQQSYTAANPGPSYGNPVPTPEPSLPMPNFSAFPYTVKNPNGGTTAYQASPPAPTSGGYYPSDQPSLVIAIGTTMKMEVESSVTVNVGTLTSSALSASIFTAISDACPPPGTKTVTGCGAPSPIQNVWYTQKATTQDPPFAMDGSIDIILPVVQYSTEAGWNASIHAIAELFGQMAANPKNVQNINSGSGGQGSANFINVGSGVQALYVTQDDTTNGIEQIELMQAKLVFEKPGSDLQLACDGASFGDALIGLLALIPGLEWLTPLALLGPAIDAECAILTSTAD